MRFRTRFLVLFLSTLLAVSGCATDEQGRRREMTDTEKGAIIGAATGVLLGLATRREAKYGALYGIVGGIAGGAVGAYMDRQKKDFEKQLAPELDRGVIYMEKLPQNRLLVGMTASTAFAVDSTRIAPGFEPVLDKIARILNKYGKTHLTIIGHTDSTGSRAYNQKLSERRAEAVKQALLARNVISERITTAGAGEDHPRASNATPEGRRKNRRVEIIIEPIVEPEG